jgi:hypothetical protein
VINGDIGPLFAPAFAPTLGYLDPEDPRRFLTMCELFERGLVNELWIAAGTDRNLYENQSRLQTYDENLRPIAGQFNSCTNGCFNDPARLVNCKVSVRMQELNKTRGAGCATHAAGHTLENLGLSIPYLRANATRFFGRDLNTRFGLPSATLSALCSTSPVQCLAHPSPGVLSSGPAFTGPAFSIQGWGAGCGSVHFPPNATSDYDYTALAPAYSSCESYGLGGNPDGTDVQQEFTSALVANYEAAYGHDFTCGGGWMVYLGQSMPGLGNQARDTQGRPMKNWWPFLFY